MHRREVFVLERSVFIEEEFALERSVLREEFVLERSVRIGDKSMHWRNVCIERGVCNREASVLQSGKGCPY